MIMLTHQLLKFFAKLLWSPDNMLLVCIHSTKYPILVFFVNHLDYFDLYVATNKIIGRIISHINNDGNTKVNKNELYESV